MLKLGGFWDIDTTREGSEGSLSGHYCFSPTPHERDTLKRIYVETSPIPTYEVDTIQVLYNPILHQQFKANLLAINVRPKEGQRGSKSYFHIQRSCKYQPEDLPEVSLVPVWFFVEEWELERLCADGFSRFVRTGKHGPGVHFCYEPEGAFSPDHPTLVLTWVAPDKLFPIHHDSSQLPQQGDYDSLLIEKLSPQGAVLHDLVVLDPRACLPAFLVTFKPRRPGGPPLVLAVEDLRLPSQQPMPPEPTRSAGPAQEMDFRGAGDLEAGLALLDKKKYTKALRAFQSVPSHSEDKPMAYWYMAYLADHFTFPPTRAQHYYSKAADSLSLFISRAQDPWSLFQLGLLVDRLSLGGTGTAGSGSGGSLRKALDYYRASDTKEAHYEIGRKGYGSIETLCLWESALKDYPPALYELAMRLYNGKGVPRDERKAFVLAKKAVWQKFPPAQYFLGVCYCNGMGRKDRRRLPSKAFHYIRLAALQGYGFGCQGLGIAYSAGIGCERDDAQAVGWFEKAVEQGDVRSYCALGVFYFWGRGGLKEDPGRARWCFEVAAKAGYGRGLYNLGVCWEGGHGGVKDVRVAYKCYLMVSRRENEKLHMEALNRLIYLLQTDPSLKELNQKTKTIQDATLPF